MREKLAAPILGNILQELNDVRVIAHVAIAEAQTLKHAEISEAKRLKSEYSLTEIEEHEEEFRQFAAEQEEAARYLLQECLELEQKAVAMLENCLRFHPPI